MNSKKIVFKRKKREHCTVLGHLYVERSFIYSDTLNMLGYMILNLEHIFSVRKLLRPGDLL